MKEPDRPLNELIHQLKERAKELNCIYEVQELLSPPQQSIEEICQGLIRVIPSGWQYPEICKVKITCMGKTYQTPDFVETVWMQSAEILVRDEPVGRISIYYSQGKPILDEGPFLKEERKLINAIAEQFGFYILHQQLRQVFQEQLKSTEEQPNEWQVILDLLKRTDPRLLMQITQKMVNFLVWNGIREADHLLERIWAEYREMDRLLASNQPYQSPAGSNILEMTDDVFAVANRNIPRKTILDTIQKWIQEDRSGFLVNTLVDPGSSLAEINSAIERYHHLVGQGIELAPSREKWFRVALIRRILTEDPDYLRVAKNFIEIDDFNDLIRRLIYPLASHGKLGGKSSGLLMAEKVLQQAKHDKELLHSIRTPKTWYITSDCLFFFVSHNSLEDVIEQKYKNVNQVRQEYPYIIHVFKNSALPPEMVKGLSIALDDFEDVPLIVRSSSLLEDRSGQSFAGKYKSLFIANQGTKEERLIALMDAVKEVFASMFGPDPLEYRLEHDLVDYDEGMGILIQEVVGARVGHYYLPAFAGVAFSHSEFRWSSRIRHEDGLIRFVPGLGTRAVDRLSDDYPVLVSPGQPGLRVNVSPDEIACYSPKKIDVINLRSRAFETVEIRDLLKEYGREYPLIHQIVSTYTGDFIYQYPTGAHGMDFEKGDFLVTFEGLLSRTPFLKQIKAMLTILQKAYGHPVDIEFAHDGSSLFLLQCRLQSNRADSIPAEIPHNIPPEQILFSAKRYISNGILSDIQFIVYVDPFQYSQLGNRQDLLMVGQVVGRLNQALPKRRFILMGPGRWGSRGDIKLGVNVTYSDINNTGMLIEIARKQNDYVPDLSFGTHFFQDLVEAAIPYLPLYPDDAGVVFNEAFLCGQKNLLATLLPDFAYLQDVVRVIDLSADSGKNELHVYMNADLEEAVAVLGRSRDP